MLKDDRAPELCVEPMVGAICVVVPPLTAPVLGGIVGNCGVESGVCVWLVGGTADGVVT